MKTFLFILRVLWRLVFYMTVVSSPLLLSFVVNPWSHELACALASGWFIMVLIGMTMKRPPANYGSYREWYADRANWWKAYPKET